MKNGLVELTFSETTIKLRKIRDEIDEIIDEEIDKETVYSLSDLSRSKLQKESLGGNKNE